MTHQQVRAEMIKRKDMISNAQEEERVNRANEKLAAAGMDVSGVTVGDKAMLIQDIYEK
jgi:hypothetical protein